LRSRRHASDLFRNPVTQLRYAVRDEHEVEPTEDNPGLGDEHVVRTVAALLLCQPGVVPLGELFEELITTIGDRSSEVGAIRGLEIQDCRSVVGSQTLQLRHDLTLFQPVGTERQGSPVDPSEHLFLAIERAPARSACRICAGG
jgi:hypothetical protein